MRPIKLQKNHGPEWFLQRDVIKFLRFRGWFVKPTHGNDYQSGFPDLFCTHSTYGIRWIEIKLPEMKGSHFTPAQLEEFPKFVANGAGIWILTAPTEREYDKLFKSPNWYTYLSWR